MLFLIFIYYQKNKLQIMKILETHICTEDMAKLNVPLKLNIAITQEQAHWTCSCLYYDLIIFNYYLSNINYFTTTALADENAP